jgi:hypothetical protein
MDMKSWLARTESSDLLSVLDELNPDTLSNSGVGLLGLNTDLLENYALGVGRATEGRRLVGGSEEALLELEIGPTSFTTMVAQLARGVESPRLSFSHFGAVQNSSLADSSIREVTSGSEWI